MYFHCAISCQEEGTLEPVKIVSPLKKNVTLPTVKLRRSIPWNSSVRLSEPQGRLRVRAGELRPLAAGSSAWSWSRRSPVATAAEMHLLGSGRGPGAGALPSGGWDRAGQRGRPPGGLSHRGPPHPSSEGSLPRLRPWPMVHWSLPLFCKCLWGPYAYGEYALEGEDRQEGEVRCILSVR